MPSPPPLPTSLSTRLQSTINPTTGACKHHPAVQLCELVQNKTRWVVRRKLCYKCGVRAPALPGRHMPGIAVKNPNNAARTPAGMEIGSGEKDKRGRSRSASKDKTSGKAERHRSESRESRGKSSSNNRSRSKSNSNNVRSSRGKSVAAITRTASNPALMASSHRLEASGRRRRGSQSHTMSRQTLNHVHDSGGDPHTPTNRPLAIMPAPTTEIVTAAPTSSSNRRASSRFETRALEFTSKVMDTTPGMTPHTSHHHHPVPSSAPAATAPYGQNHGALVPHTVNAHRSSPAGTTGNYNYGPPTIPHLDEHHQTHPKSDVPNNIKLGASSTDFGESDPIITIQLGDDGKMPPPPPRTVDELERHQERLEMRRAHIRRNLKQNNTSAPSTTPSSSLTAPSRSSSSARAGGKRRS